MTDADPYGKFLLTQELIANMQAPCPESNRGLFFIGLMAKKEKQLKRPRAQRQCIKCFKCECRGSDPAEWNFNPYNFDNPKAFNNIFCTECLQSALAPELYKKYARPHFARKYGNKYAPDKATANSRSPWRRKSKHPGS